MKLSSKILIGLGIALFIIPIVTTSYIVGHNRVDTKVYEDILRQEGTDPNSKDTYLKTFKTKNFNNVNVIGNQKGSIGLFLVKSDKYAVKMDKNSESEVAVSVSAEGQLNIELKDNAKSYYKRIYIFTPNIAQIKLSNLIVNDFSGQCDQLEIIGDTIEEFKFNSNIAINKLTLHLKKSLLSTSESESLQIPDFTLDLDSSVVNLVNQNNAQVSVQAKDSKVNFFAKNPNVKLKTLHLKTVGNSIINLNDSQFESIDGQLSEETKTDFSIGLLRRILK
jgi:hypothetical protein